LTVAITARAAIGRVTLASTSRAEVSRNVRVQHRVVVGRLEEEILVLTIQEGWRKTTDANLTNAVGPGRVRGDDMSDEKAGMVIDTNNLSFTKDPDEVCLVHPTVARGALGEETEEIEERRLLGSREVFFAERKRSGGEPGV